MCLAVPLKILRVLDGGKAVVAQGSGELQVDVSLLEKPQPGDHVIVHAGYAIEILSLQEASERLELFRQMAALMEGEEAAG
jgi:hydrogenase expression/formation protein HypC